jgi:hypothetical protein
MEGRLPLEVAFILCFNNIWFGPLILSFKFGEDLTSGCRDILHFVLLIYLWLVGCKTDTHNSECRSTLCQFIKI